MWGLVVLGVAASFLTVWGIWAGSRSEYYASIALSMSQNWHNFFYGSFDPAGTVTLDKIPGSYWVPALFVRLFGFSTWAIILPNALAAVGATLLAAFTAKRLAGPTAGLVAGAVVATTPILVAVARSNQPETFFVLGLALTAWAAAKALTRRSLGWLVVAGLFVALSFQMYMLEAWAVWPALAAAYLTTRQPWVRKLWHTAVAGMISLAASLTWIVVVWLVPASQRPYIGSTLRNSPWEMVFGYNGLGRFGDSTADAAAYNSFTPPFSGDPGAFRLFTEQLAGQVAWLLPAAVLGVVVLAVLRWRPPVTVFLGVWLVTFYGMFSVVAGMHQFYTAALAVPMGLSVGLAFGVARSRGVRWAQISLVGVAAATALAIASVYGGYSMPVAIGQAVAAVLAVVLIIVGRGRVVGVVTVVAVVAMLLTPAVWSVVTMGNPSAINPVAGGVTDMGGGAGRPGGSFGGQRDGRGAPPQGGGQGAPDGTRGGGMQGGGMPGGGMPGGQGESTALLSYLEANRGQADYLVATFGAQTAAGLITASGGESVLPIRGFSSADPVPTLDAFKALVADGKLQFVLAGGQGGGQGGGRAESSEVTNIRTWVTQNCVQVTDAATSGLYRCSAT